MNTNTNTKATAKRWLAGFVMAAGLGTAFATGSAVASADTGTATNATASESTAGTTTGPSTSAGTSERKLVEQIGTPRSVSGKIFEIQQDVTCQKAQSHCDKRMDDYIRG